MPPLPTSPFLNSMEDTSLATKLPTNDIIAVVCYGHCRPGMVLLTPYTSLQQSSSSNKGPEAGEHEEGSHGKSDIAKSFGDSLGL